MTSPYGLDRDTSNRAAMDRLNTHGSEFGTAWGTHQSAITTGEGGIGQGILADVFRAMYQGADEMKLSADAVPGVCFEIAGLGHRCADLYDDGVDHAVRALRAAQAGDL